MEAVAPFHDYDFLILEEKRKQNTELALAVLVLWDVEAIADHTMSVPGLGTYRYVRVCVCVCVCVCVEETRPKKQEKELEKN